LSYARRVKFRIHVEGFEVEIGSGKDERHPAALAFAAAAAPLVVDWLTKRFGIKEWERTPEPPPSSSSSEREPDRHVVDGDQEDEPEPTQQATNGAPAAAAEV
jgi:hypothetical protein